MSAGLKGRENVYVCGDCGRHLVTVDRDEGTTPMFMTCGYRSPPGCGGRMVSSMYPEGPRPSHIWAPTHEWYRPTADELDAECAREPAAARAIRDHVRKGGLLIRPIAPVGVVS